MGRAPRALAVAVLACLALCAAASGAFNSKVTVNIGFEGASGRPFFKGEVKSGSERCRQNRPVTVYRQQNHRRIRFGATRSDSNGHWRLAMAEHMKTAGYIAVAKAMSGCLKGFSSPIGVGQHGPDGAG
jgi:hypothetical protein